MASDPGATRTVVDLAAYQPLENGQVRARSAHAAHRTTMHRGRLSHLSAAQVAHSSLHMPCQAIGAIAHRAGAPRSDPGKEWKHFSDFRSVVQQVTVLIPYGFRVS